MEIRNANLFCSAKNAAAFNSQKANLSFGTKVETTLPVKNLISELSQGNEKRFWEFLRDLLPKKTKVVSLSMIKKEGIPAIKARTEEKTALITDSVGHWNARQLTMDDIMNGINKISGNI